MTDATGARVPAADVQAVSQTTAETRKATTDAAGNFLIGVLPPGLYRLTVRAKGFQTMVFSDIHVDLTETTEVPAVLVVGPLSESIIVRATTPAVQNDGAQLGRVVDGRNVAELPLATRNFTQILSLSPGTATFLPDSTAVGRNTQAISVNGARVTQNNLQVNGVDANTMGTNGPILVAVPAPESIEEFKVQTSLYDATFGRAGGANIQLVTRSGGNAFHGAAYHYLRNDALNANNPFLKAAGAGQPVLRRNVFGGTLGGPLRREKSFFFVSYQGTRETNGASIINSISSNVLVAPGLTDNRAEPVLRAAFHVPAIHPAALALLQARLPDGRFLIPTPQGDGRYSGSEPSTFQEDQFNTNADWRIRQNHSLAVKVFFSNSSQSLALPSFRGTGPNVPGFGTEQSFNNRVAAIQDVYVVRPNLLNEARIGYALNTNAATPQEPVSDAQVGIIRSNSASLPGLPLIRIAPAAGGVIIGTPTNINPAKPSVATLADTLSATMRKHILRAGGEFRYNEVNSVPGQFTRGQIVFQDFTSFLAGTTQTTTFGNGLGGRSQRALDYNFFFQDDWKILPRLTVSLGLRYELDLPVYETRGRLSTFDPALYRPRLDIRGGPPAGGFVQAGNVIASLRVPGVPVASKYVVRSIAPNNVAPRAGFAWSLLGSVRLALRGGYGIFHSRPTFQYSSMAATVPPLFALGNLSGRPLDNPFFPIPPPDQFPTFVPGLALSGTVFDRNMAMPYVHQFNLSMQYEAVRDLLLEIAYVGARGRNLFRQVAINQARLASPQSPIRNEVTGELITTNTRDNAGLRAPFQGVSITGFSQNQTTAESRYDSLQVSLTRRFSRGLQMLASYTLGRSIDNASGSGGGAGIAGVVNTGAVGDTGPILGNQLDPRANRGVSDFDRAHRLVVSYVWDLPAPGFALPSTVGRRLFGGWSIAGIVTAMSGLPIDVVDTNAGSFYGLAGGSNPLARPNVEPAQGCSAAARDVPPGYFFNPAAFVRPVVQAGRPVPSAAGNALAGALGTDLGNAERNCLTGPRQVNVDFALSKRFPIRENRGLEFRAEFFNLFNRVNVANPISNLNAVLSPGGSINLSTGQIINPGNFGRIISTSNNPRIIQLALKFSF